jgi:hypothetical protein
MVLQYRKQSLPTNNHPICINRSASVGNDSGIKPWKDESLTSFSSLVSQPEYGMLSHANKEKYCIVNSVGNFPRKKSSEARSRVYIIRIREAFLTSLK